jgi:uncharacterized protein YegJ (DUF2314 family)
MKTLLTMTALLFLAVVCGCGARSKPETLVEGGYDEAEMEAAIAKARSEVGKFLTEMEAKNGESFSVKAPVNDNGKVEHFWLTDITYANGEFEGVIGNDPGIVTNVKFGQKWKIKKEEISDWMFMRNDKIHGNYTMRPLLKTLPPAEAAKLRKMLAD